MREGRTRDSISECPAWHETIMGGNIQIPDPSLQANEPSRLPAKTVFKFNISTPAGWNGCAR